MNRYMCWIIGAISMAMSMSAFAQFSDDFEAYPPSDPANFSATTNWTWNGLGTAPNASRIFNTGNFGGSRLWIASAANANAGTGINSRGIVVDPNTLYLFEGNLVTETSVDTRTATFDVDLLIGANAGTATSVIGGPTNITARGDDAAGGEDSYADQITTISFNSGAVGPGDFLFIKIAATSADASNPFIGVDNISISSLADSDMDGLTDQWEIDNFGSITNWTGADDPDFDSLTNTGEFAMATEPLNPDTDDDGLTDGVETDTGTVASNMNTGTDPLDADSDNDGVIDGAEVLIYGSDPFQEDKDSDGSPDIVELTVGTNPNDLFDDPIDNFNLLMGNMAVGQDWTEGLFFNFFSAAADDVWVVGGSGSGFGQLIRNPEGVGTTFPGPSLILTGPGATFRMKQNDGQTVTVNDLRLRGGTVDNGNTGMTLVLDGAVTVEAHIVTNQAAVVTTPSTTNANFSAATDSVFQLFESNRGIIVDASLAGDGGLIVRQGGVTTAPRGTVSIRSLTNVFTGGWTVEDVAILKGAGLVSLGSGDITLNGGMLDADYNLALMDSTVTVGTPTSVLVVDKEHYVGALIIGTNDVAAGTYTAAQLVALADPAYSNSFTDGGGTVIVTGIGSGDADGNGIPDAWEFAVYGSIGQNPNEDADVGGPDGLTVAMEFAAGTDPQVRDSDGDTLLDGAEIFTHGTDPTKQDTDGDTLRDDGELVGVGARPPTNPTNADTDGDGLSDLVESNTGTFVDANDTGTDPTDIDSDGDLFRDGDEVAAGSDPNDPFSVPGGFLDNFEDYPSPANPADFSATGNWTWNGVGGANANRIFTTGNFGVSQLWIFGDGDIGTGIDSRPIGIEANKFYNFNGNLVCETTFGDRKKEFSVDLLIGTNITSAVSVLGTPASFIGRGDHSASIPGSIPGSYADQNSSVSFFSGAIDPLDRLFIRIVYVGPTDGSAFGGVDNISITQVADTDNDQLPDFWEIENFGSITNWTGTDDPDMDLLDNAGEYDRKTDPLDPDTDDDDLTDKVETGTGVYLSTADTGTDPLDPDTDNDGLKDGVETDTGIFVSVMDTGTDPHDADTDDDTFGDGTEIAAGSDPFDPASFPEWCSGAFAVRYEAMAGVPSVENAAEGWVETGPAAVGPGVIFTNGMLLIDTYDATTNANTGGGAWSENPSGGAWGAAVGSGNPSYTYEIRARVLADAGDFGLVIWTGHAGDPGTAIANITTNAVYWGLDRTTFLSDTNGIDNSTDFHLYRVMYNADTSSYSVYRDGVLLADGLGAGITSTQTRVIVGDIGSTGSVKAEVDYIRWDVGIPWTPSPPTADCDGDGLLNNQEDVNGNGAVDPGETDEANPDSDGDGSSDGDEVLVAGTDPTDAGSVLKVVDAAALSAGTLDWASVPGKTYRVQFRASLSTGGWGDLADVSASGTGTTSYSDPAGAGTEGYYRVLVLFP